MERRATQGSGVEVPGRTKTARLNPGAAAKRAQRTSAPRTIARWAMGLGLVLLMTGMGAGPGRAVEAVSIVVPAQQSRHVSQADYELVLEVSAFSPLRRIAVNGKAVSFTPGTWVVLRLPQRLQPGKNRFAVQAETAQGSAEAQFEITYYPDGVRGEDRVDLLARLSYQRDSNARRTPAPRPGQRTALLLIPAYAWQFESSALRLEGRGLVDRYHASALREQEIRYGRLGLEWQSGLGEDTGRTRVGLAAESIRADADPGQVDIAGFQRNVLMYAGLEQPLGLAHRYRVALELKRKQYATPQVAPPGEENSTSARLKAAVESATHQGSRVEAELGLAQGAQTGGRKLALGLAGAWGPRWGQVGLDLGLGWLREEALEDNPAYGFAPGWERATAHAAVVFSPSRSWAWTLKLAGERQDANVSTWRYENTSLSMAVTYIR